MIYINNIYEYVVLFTSYNSFRFQYRDLVYFLKIRIRSVFPARTASALPAL